MPNVTVADLTAATENLAAATADVAKTAAAIDRFIAARAKEIGDRLGVGYAKTAAEQIKDKEFELQRATDVVRELRRQMKPLERHSDALARVRKAIAGARTDGATAIDIDYLIGVINAPAEPGGEEIRG